MRDGDYIEFVFLLTLALLVVFLSFIYFRTFFRPLNVQLNDEKARYRQKFFLVINSAIILAVWVMIAFRPETQNVQFQSIFMPAKPRSTISKIAPFLIGGMGILLVFQFVDFLKEQKKMLKQSQATRPRTKHPLPFFWQAFFILLPVAGLACFGLYSLRQDRFLAEEEARESGEVLAQQLAQAVSVEGEQSFDDYREANFDLHANQMADIGLSHWQGDIQSESNAWLRINLWQRANPGIVLSSLPPAVGLDYGYTVSQLETMPPQPPEWLGQLNSEQRQLWESAKEMEFRSGDSATAQSAIRKFIAARPPDGARANAEYLLLLAKTRGVSNQEAAAQFANSRWNNSDQLTEAGLPVGQLICYQALRLMPDGAGVPAKLLNTVPWAITYRPSFFSIRLIAEAERVAKGTDSETKVAALKTWWEAERKAFLALEDFRNQYPANTWNPGAYWLNSRVGNFLFLVGDPLSIPTDSVFPNLFLMIPRSLVEKTLATAVTQSGILAPPYARAEFQMAGQTVSLPPDETAMATDGVLPVLGQADGHWEGLPGLSTPNRELTYPFRIRVLLASPTILYARQRERTWMFSGLIVASTAAAMLALFAAYRSFRRQQELNELKTNFVSSVSHELRAPIAAVRLMAENLESGKIREAPRQGEYFRFIVQECRRLSSLIENVLDFSRIEQGRKQYEFVPTDLAALARGTVKLMEPYAVEKGVRLEFHSESGTANCELDLDGRAIQQALVNLIDNAIKHSPKGETVTVGLEITTVNSRPSTFNLVVADRGPGIPPEEHGRIFERFYRLGSELRRETQGVGIGLSIVKHIVEAHHGRVLVQSQPGRGSRFTIELPIGS